MAVEFKALRFEVKEMTEAGEFKGYASTRKKDSYGDIVAPGAFKRTIDHNAGAVPVLWFHDPMRPIGKSMMMAEDEHGLYTEGVLDLDIEDGRRVYSGMRKGYIDRMSIGFMTMRDSWDKQQDARIIEEVKLLEYSMITKNFAANDAALVTGVKSLPGLLDQVVGLKDTDADAETIRKAIDALTALLQGKSSASATSTLTDAPIQRAGSDDATLRALINEMKAALR